MKVWKTVFHSILEIFHSIPFWHLLYSIPKFPFHSIPFHTIPWLSILYYYCYILPQRLEPVSDFANLEAPDFEKIASASSSFSTLSLPSLLPLPTSSVKVLLIPLPQKINCFRFHIPGCSNGPNNMVSVFAKSLI